MALDVCEFGAAGQKRSEVQKHGLSMRRGYGRPLVVSIARVQISQAEVHDMT